MANLNHLSRMLVVEDEAIIALDIESTLRDAGVNDIAVTSSEDEALQLIEAGNFDAAVLDLHLGFNSWTYAIARALRAKAVPFIFSSGTVDIADGYADVPLVMKPFSTDQLLAALLQVTTPPQQMAAQ
ncbi:MAG TPA: response regulator [Devosia sp.]|jgi:CheY-like chemotaxis protein|nr:response regulator [Devosia sp.]